MKLATWMQQQGRTSADVAAELSDALGRPIKASTVTMWGGRPSPPKAWADALGISPDPAPESPPREAATAAGEDLPPEGLRREHEQRPKPPQGAPIAIPVETIAKKRIAETYGLFGAAATQLTGNRGISRVVDDSSPHIADAWIAAAQENDFARRVVNLMSAGGAVGELVSAHIIMVGGLLYVTGRFPDVGLYGRYRQYRPIEQPPPTGEGHDGAAANGAGDPLADAAAPPSL